MTYISDQHVSRGNITANILAGGTARKLLWRLIMVYLLASVAAVIITFFLVLIGLEFTLTQWLGLFSILPFALTFYLFIDIYLIRRHFTPVGVALVKLEAGNSPTREEISWAIVRALNLPFYFFLRVTFVHGPLATISVVAVSCPL